MSTRFSGLVLAAAVCVSHIAGRSSPRRPHRHTRNSTCESNPLPGSNPPLARRTRTSKPQPYPRLGVNEVNLIFTVTDKKGHYIPNLQQSDFALLDDQKAPAKITSFRPAD